MKKICITGGAGYVGSQLVPHLIALGYDVTVIDTFWYGLGDKVFPHIKDKSRLTLFRGDIRDSASVEKAFENQDAVIHLACISNDPSFEMNPTFGKSINFDCFQMLLNVARAAGVKRFIYASSSSVYGVQDTPDVTEEVKCKPLTDYSTYKLMCEQVLKESKSGLEWVIVRPATVCGWAPRLRLDLSVNVLTIQALINKKITVFGGSQLRPNINIKDMVRAYAMLLSAPKAQVHGQIFNVGFENKSIMDIAKLVRNIAGGEIVVDEKASDNRSYHVNSDKIEYSLGFRPEHSIERAVRSLMHAYEGGKMSQPLTNPLYYNIKRMKEMGLT